MGGSVIVRASGPLLTARYRLVGVAVLDVVEGWHLSVLVFRDSLIVGLLGIGFTLEALPLMHNLLDSRPDGFGSTEEAIRWQ